MLARRPANRRITVALTGLLAVLLAIAALFATLPAVAEEAPSGRFTAEDLFSLQVASSPQISPDGRTIVYVRRSGDIMTDRMVPALWLIDVATGKQTRFVAGGSSPRWSHDGSRIAYLASDGDGRQIFVKRVATGETTRVTTLSGDPRAPAWSPDGRQIAFVATVAENAKRFGQVPAKPEGAKWAEPLQVIDRVTYRADGGGYIEPGRDHVFVVPTDGGAARQLTFGAYDDGGPLSWRADGATILFSAIRGKDADREVSDSNVFAVNVASGALTQLTTRYGPDASPVFSPASARIAWLGFDDKHRAFENNELYVGDSQARDARSLTSQLDRSIESAQWLGTKL